MINFKDLSRGGTAPTVQPSSTRSSANRRKTDGGNTNIVRSVQVPRAKTRGGTDLGQLNSDIRFGRMENIQDDDDNYGDVSPIPTTDSHDYTASNRNLSSAKSLLRKVGDTYLGPLNSNLPKTSTYAKPTKSSKAHKSTYSSASPSLSSLSGQIFKMEISSTREKIKNTSSNSNSIPLTSSPLSAAINSNKETDIYNNPYDRNMDGSPIHMNIDSPLSPYLNDDIFLNNNNNNNNRNTIDNNNDNNNNDFSPYGGDDTSPNSMSLSYISSNNSNIISKNDRPQSRKPYLGSPVGYNTNYPTSISTSTSPYTNLKVPRSAGIIPKDLSEQYLQQTIDIIEDNLEIMDSSFLPITDTTNNSTSTSSSSHINNLNITDKDFNLRKTSSFNGFKRPSTAHEYESIINVMTEDELSMSNSMSSYERPPSRQRTAFPTHLADNFESMMMPAPAFEFEKSSPSTTTSNTSKSTSFPSSSQGKPNRKSSLNNVYNSSIGSSSNNNDNNAATTISTTTSTENKEVSKNSTRKNLTVNKNIKTNNRGSLSVSTGGGGGSGLCRPPSRQKIAAQHLFDEEIKELRAVTAGNQSTVGYNNNKQRPDTALNQSNIKNISSSTNRPKSSNKTIPNTTNNIHPSTAPLPDTDIYMSSLGLGSGPMRGRMNRNNAQIHDPSADGFVGLGGKEMNFRVEVTYTRISRSNDSLQSLNTNNNINYNSSNERNSPPSLLSESSHSPPMYDYNSNNNSNSNNSNSMHQYDSEPNSPYIDIISSGRSRTNSLENDREYRDRDREKDRNSSGNGNGNSARGGSTSTGTTSGILGLSNNKVNAWQQGATTGTTTGTDQIQSTNSSLNTSRNLSASRKKGTGTGTSGIDVDRERHLDYSSNINTTNSGSGSYQFSSLAMDRNGNGNVSGIHSGNNMNTTATTNKNNDQQWGQHRFSSEYEEDVYTDMNIVDHSARRSNNGNGNGNGRESPFAYAEAMYDADDSATLLTEVSEDEMVAGGSRGSPSAYAMGGGGGGCPNDMGGGVGSGSMSMQSITLETSLGQ
eukprot:gene4965-9933_t